MPYLGNPAVDRFTSTKAASVYSGDGSTVAFTLEHSVGADEDILVSVDGVIQEPSVAYAVSSGTTLTFTAAPSNNAGNNIFVYYLFRTIGTVTHPPTSALSATSGTFSTTLGVTGASTLSGNATIGANDGDTRFHLNSANQYTMKFSNAGNVSGHIGGGGSDVLRFSNAAGATIMEMNAGQITMPLQPAFLVQPAERQSNVADDTTLVFGTEIFDQNADFASNTFTAPVTGRYQLQVALRIDNVDTAANFCRAVIKTSNRNYIGAMIDPAVLSADPGEWNFNFSVLADMDANDTVFITWSQSAGADQADVETDCFFSGFLAC